MWTRIVRWYRVRKLATLEQEAKWAYKDGEDITGLIEQIEELKR